MLQSCSYVTCYLKIFEKNVIILYALQLTTKVSSIINTRLSDVNSLSLPAHFEHPSLSGAAELGGIHALYGGIAAGELLAASRNIHGVFHHVFAFA